MRRFRQLGMALDEARHLKQLGVSRMYGVASGMVSERALRPSAPLPHEREAPFFFGDLPPKRNAAPPRGGSNASTPRTPRTPRRASV